jgi:hypothetical protein
MSDETIASEEAVFRVALDIEHSFLHKMKIFKRKEYLNSIQINTFKKNHHERTS